MSTLKEMVDLFFGATDPARRLAYGSIDQMEDDRITRRYEDRRMVPLTRPRTSAVGRSIVLRSGSAYRNS